MQPTDPTHPRSSAAALGGALAILVLALVAPLGVHPTAAEGGAVTTVCAYVASLLPVGRFGS